MHNDQRGDDVIADSISPAARALRTFAWFVFIGFLTLVLAPPVLGLLTALISVSVALTTVFLPFALLGLLVWVPYQLLTHGGEGTWRRTRELVTGVGQTTLGMPFRVCGGAWSRACHVGQSVREFNRQALRFVGVLLLEALSGGLVGLLVAFLISPDYMLRPGLGFLCAGIGAGLGALVAVAHFLPAASEPADAT